jgi:hypothetical protein
VSGELLSESGWVSDIALERSASIIGRRARHRVFGEGVVVQEETTKHRSVVIRFADGERDVPFGLGLLEVENA